MTLGNSSQLEDVHCRVEATEPTHVNGGMFWAHAMQATDFG